MGVQRKQYSKEFKEETVRLITEGGVSVAQAPRDLRDQRQHSSSLEKGIE